MSCTPGRPLFRLLDPRVGWSPASAEGLDALDPEQDLRLALAGGQVGEDPAAAIRVFGDARLARGCGPCEWYVLAGVAGVARRVLRLDPCHRGARPVWAGAHAPGVLDPVVIAARGDLLAAADGATRTVHIWDGGGNRLRARLELDGEPVALALAPWGEVLVGIAGSDGGQARVRRFSVDGQARTWEPWAVPGQVVGFAFGRPDADQLGDACAVLLLTRADDGILAVWRVARDRPEASRVTVAEALALAGPGGVASVGERGFCLGVVQDAGPGRGCWSWLGRSMDAAAIAAPPPRALATRGQLLTLPLDSGIPRCQWHRIRIEADVPRGTAVQVDVATSAVADPAPQGSAGPGWEAFAGGVPHPGDWQRLPAGLFDVLLDRPPGRYLFVRIRLLGDGVSTPVVHGVRLDLPRATSLDRLPGIWQEDPAAADFTARFLSLFDAQLAELDRAIERHPALLDPASVPDAVLPWLAGLLGVGIDPAWSPARRRAILRAAPELYRLRGTPKGLRCAVELVFGPDPVIEELSRERAWGFLGSPGHGAPPGGARLGAVRLFAPARVRFQLDRSPLSGAPLRSQGDPRADARSAGAYRFRVLVPPAAAGASGDLDPARLRSLVASQAPAHTVGQIHLGGAGLVVGLQSAVGIDTVLLGPAAPVLGRAGGPGGTVRLNRRSVLRPGRTRRSPGMAAGDAAVVGINTVVR